MHRTFRDHRRDPAALGGTLRGDGPAEPQAPGHGREQFDMTMGHRAFHGEGGFGADRAPALEHPVKGIDLLRRPVGEAGQGPLAYPRAFAPTFAQQDRGRESRSGTVSTYMAAENMPLSFQ